MACFRVRENAARGDGNTASAPTGCLGDYLLQQLAVYTENLSLDGRRALKKLLQANRRLNTAYILKETFGQLWDYRTERGPRAFFTRWKDSLKWQRLHPYQKFAGMIECRD